VLTDLKYYPGFENENTEVIVDAAATTFLVGKTKSLIPNLLQSWKEKEREHERIATAVLEGERA
jgi:hypothetical protein